MHNFNCHTSWNPQRRLSARHFRPRVEVLEDRRMLALFIENFSNDSDSSQPGFDTWDGDPSTVFPDEMAIPHQISSHVAIASTALFPPAPSAPHFLALTRPNASYIIDFRTTQGQPGGLDPDGEVVAVTIGYSGLGRLEFFGENGTKRVTDFGGFSSWRNITVTGNSLSDSGTEMGAIQWVLVAAVEGLYVDDVAVLVLDSGFSNNPPVANDDLLTTLPGRLVSFDPLANDGDTDGDPVRLLRALPPPPATGTIVVHDGLVTYTPAPGFHGIATFDYFITDDRIPAGSEVQGTVRITVNTPPPASGATIPVPHGHTGPFTFAEAAVIGGATDADGDVLTIASLGVPLFGSLARNGDGTITYTPSPTDGLMPDDLLFECLLSDGFTVGERGVAKLDPNERPIASGQILNLEHGTPGPLQGLLHFSDPDGDPLDLTLVDWTIDPFTGQTRMAHGVLILNDGRSLDGLTGDIEFTYFPSTGDLRASDQFTFRVTDFYGTSSTATIDVRVPNYRPEVVIPAGQSSLILNGGISLASPSGSAPVTGDLFDWFDRNGYSALERPMVPSPETFAIDLDHDPLTAVLADQPAHGTVVIAPDGDFTYTPDPTAGMFGTDTFSFRVSDGVELSSQVIFVTIEQSLGNGFARSDVYWTSDDDSVGSFGLPDPLIIDYRTLLANDYFDTHWDPTFVIRGWQIERNSQPVFRANADLKRIDPLLHDDDSYVRLDELIIFNPIYRLDPGETETHIFQYRFLYSPPGLPDSVQLSELAASSWGQVVVVIHDEVEGDSDGVYDEVEEQYGDGNSDGVSDAIQPHVVSLPAGRDVPEFPVPSITLVSAGQTSLFRVTSKGLNSAEVAEAPPATQFPLGIVDFSVVGVGPGEAAEVTLIPHLALTGIYVNSYFKFGVEPEDDPATPDLNESMDRHWYEFLYDGTTGAEIFYRRNGFEFALSPDTPAEVYADPSVRITRIVLHLVDGQRGDHDLDQNGIIRDPGGPAFVGVPPRVASVVVNDGHSQRSMIRSLTVTFDALVSIESNAFELRRIGASRPVLLNVESSDSGGTTAVRLTFQGAGVHFGSLADGDYRLLIKSAKIKSADGSVLDGDSDGLAGGDRVDEFFRRFGDTDGDDDVDLVDADVFGRAFGKRSHQPGYLWYLDYNASGRIWAEDLALFLLGYIRSPRR